MPVEIFEIGGCVRDALLGLPAKDIDFVAIAPSFEDMILFIQDSGLKIVVTTPDFFTIRAVTPKTGFRGYHGGLDFVWAREEGPYSDGRRPDWVKPGTLETDQNRRDFTVNAMAKDAQGNLIDPHNGRADLRVGILRAVGDPFTRLTEDALRAVRALRFSVTKDFVIDPHLRWAMQTAAVLDALEHKISDERIQQELSKMVRHDPVASIIKFNEFPALTRVLFSGSVNLDATMKQRGFN